MTVETADPSDFDDKEIYEDLREDSQPRSVHTSVDAKIAYLEEEDEFGLVITETNAFPEAQEYCESIHDEDWIQNTVDSLASNIPDEASEVVVNLPGHSFDGDHDWLQSEKNAITDGLEEEIEEIETTIDGENLEVTEDAVRHQETEYDFVINLSDVGDHLDESTSSLEANQNIMNAATAVWNTSRQETGKAGLHQSTEKVMDALNLEKLYAPENQEIETFSETVESVKQYFEKEESAVLKGNFGTHGDEVVHLNYNEFETMSRKFRIGVSDYVKHKVKEVEQRVRQKKTAENNYSIFDGEDRFDGRGERSTAVVEKAIEGETDLGNESAQIIDYEGRPLDLVFTVWDMDDEYRIGATIRASERDDTINANCGSQNFDLVSYDQAFEEGIYQNDGPQLQNILENYSDRQVERDELMKYAGRVAATSLGARNLSAYRAEN